jgi:hypothetical protein
MPRRGTVAGKYWAGNFWPDGGFSDSIMMPGLKLTRRMNQYRLDERQLDIPGWITWG